jgi:hypothetical protein
MVINSKNKGKLYKQTMHLLGAPIRSIELDDDQMDSLLEISLGEYEQFIQDWLIESQWTSLHGLNVDEQSLSRAFTTRSMDYETQYTYAYSKIVGLQTGGDWVLQKDFIELQEGQQMYHIPKGRELNELLWFNRAELNESLIDPFMGGFGGFGGTGIGGGGGFAQMGVMGSYFMMPAFDILLRMQDRNLKNRIIGGDLTYRVTAAPDGGKFIHLLNVPGGRFDFGSKSLNQSKVWYWYYDTEDRKACMKDNPDVIKLPSDVETEDMTWETLNKPGQNWVRKYFIATCKEALGRVRGKFGGNLKVPDSELSLEYDSLLTEGKDEKMKLIEELQARLERLRPDKMLERRASEAENLNKTLSYRPFQGPFNAI